MSDEFTIARGTMPETRGRHKRPLRLHMEQLKPGEVLRWRPEATKGCTFGNIHSVIRCLRKQNPEQRFRVCKEDGGFDIFRTH